ncbi:MAG: hypothetical protein P4M11_07020, partial [Candidatus Pacebacteria bacterium]|nr:hypothetical protein [Candidatus Paceibacterota bacterium]
MAQAVADQWKALTPAEQKPYQDQANAFRAELAEAEHAKRAPGKRTRSTREAAQPAAAAQSDSRSAGGSKRRREIEEEEEEEEAEDYESWTRALCEKVHQKAVNHRNHIYHATPLPNTTTPLIYSQAALDRLAAMEAAKDPNRDHLVHSTAGKLHEQQLIDALRDKKCLDLRQFPKGVSKMKFGPFPSTVLSNSFSEEKMEEMFKCRENEAIIGEDIKEAKKTFNRGIAYLSYEYQWRNGEPMKHGAPAPGSPDAPSNPMGEFSFFLSNLSPQEQRGAGVWTRKLGRARQKVLDAVKRHKEASRGEKAVTKKEVREAKEKEIDLMEEAMSFFKPALGGAVKQVASMVMDYWKHHDLSLWNLLKKVDSIVPGIFHSYLYFKMLASAAFELHSEQCGLPFANYQLSGHSIWILLRLDDEDARDRFNEMILKMALVRARTDSTRTRGRSPAPTYEEYLERDPAERKVWLDLAMLLYRAKNLMPPIDLLDECEIPYRVRILGPGQLLSGNGNVPHMGFSISREMAISLASNQLDVFWLRYGPADVLRQWQWVSRLADLNSDSLDMKLNSLCFGEELVANALHHSPPSFTCSMIRAVLKDLKKGVNAQHEDQYKLVGLKHHTANRAETIGMLKSILVLLHSNAVTEFLKTRYVAQDYRRGFMLCKHKHKPDDAISDDSEDSGDENGEDDSEAEEEEESGEAEEEEAAAAAAAAAPAAAAPAAATTSMDVEGESSGGSSKSSGGVGVVEESIGAEEEEKTTPIKKAIQQALLDQANSA